MTEIAKQSMASVVGIEAYRADGSQTFGSGFVIRRDGLVVTNFHVLSGATRIIVHYDKASSTQVTGLYAFDRDSDLAVVQAPPSLPVTPLRIGDSGALAVGERVVVIGNPLGIFERTVSDGLISAIRHVTPEFSVLQVTAPISHGSSGGPILSQSGTVVGVVVATMRDGQNINFGIPSNTLLAVLNQAKPISLEDFVANAAEASTPSPGTSPSRQVPEHARSVWKGCSVKAQRFVYQTIAEAIDIGAPIYNEGKHEACFRIYEGAALNIERTGKCRGAAQALKDGRKRAESQSNYTDKAWAMRDAFDGLLIAHDRFASTSSLTDRF